MNIHLQQFQRDAAGMADNADQRAYLRDALNGYEEMRDRTQAIYADYQGARDAASAIKWDAILHLDVYLRQFVDTLESRGTHVCWASDAHHAREYIRSVLRRTDARSIVKSKTMTSEEIELNAVLEADGYTVVETDLGEFIVQLRNEPPYHFVAPAMHLKRDAISRDFHRHLHEPLTEDPEELTMQARRALRERYLQAEVGITGANFAVADPGVISITENEGNARLTFGLPPIHIAIVGIEKVLPTMEDLALFLPLLAVNGTGQHLTSYNTLIGGPATDDEPDGPREFHVVLLDNRRTTLLADPVERDALRCIRCGACLNVCPVFRNVGGHTYGTTYQGPIGSVITPHLRGMGEWSHLSQASSLCGACTASCPVRIDLHHHLLRNRAIATTRPGERKWSEAMIMRLFAAAMTRPRVYRFLSRIARPLHACARPFFGSRIDPLRNWRRTRTLPDPPREPFHLWWQRRKTGGGGRA